MRKQIISIIILALTIPFEAFNQVGVGFEDNQELELKIDLRFKDFKRSTNDSIYQPSWIGYRNTNDSWDSIKIGIRTRGKFRLENCYFPPLKLKFYKENRMGTPFEKNKTLKLVLPCQKADVFNELLMNEFMIYKMLEVVYPYALQTQLVSLNLNDYQSHPPKHYDLHAFIIEDEENLEYKFNGKIKDDIRLHPIQLQDSASAVLDLFQYFIGNIDWSTVYQHNIKILHLDNGAYIPIAYDFDMCLMVNPPYIDKALGNAKYLGSEENTRYFRGFCKNDHALNWARKLFLNKKNEILSILEEYAQYFSETKINYLKSFINEFFEELSSDQLFSDRIMATCRQK